MVSLYLLPFFSIKRIVILCFFVLYASHTYASFDHADNPTPETTDFQRCLGLPDQERLICYDELAIALPTTQSDLNHLASSQSAWDNLLETQATQTPPHEIATNTAAHELQTSPSYLENMWGLRPDTQTPLFALRPYASSYILLGQYADRVNRQPSSPSPGRQLSSYTDYDQIEAKFQLSIKSKLGHNLLFANDSLWFGYTQISQWQIWSPHISRPFRATSYMPEFFYVMPIQFEIPGTQWTWRMASLGIIHESNGQSNPLSRSWNRAYIGVGFDHPDFSLYMRAWSRFPESASSDDNPQITTYVGRADLRLNWEIGNGNTFGMRFASNLKDMSHGSIQLDYYFPISRFWGMGDHLRGYIQFFHGYGETITDYNFRRTTLGIGLALREW